jgi:hypothetical protein
MSQQVAGGYEVCIGSAHSAWGFLRYPTRTHEAVLTTSAGNAEVTLWLLTVKAVEHRFYAQFLQMQQHLPHRRIRSLLYLLLLIGKGLSIFVYRSHIVLSISVHMRVFGVMMMVGMRLLMSQYLFIASLA